MGKDLLIIAWFILIAVSFFGAYLGIALPGSVLQATYSTFLIVSLSGLVLYLLSVSKKPGTEGGEKSRVD